MNEKISNAIIDSATYDQIEHVIIEGEDIYSVMEGVPYDDMIQLEHGEWDVWGSDEDAGGEYRLHIYLNK